MQARAHWDSADCRIVLGESPFPSGRPSRVTRPLRHAYWAHPEMAAWWICQTHLPVPLPFAAGLIGEADTRQMKLKPLRGQKKDFLLVPVQEHENWAFLDSPCRRGNAFELTFFFFFFFSLLWRLFKIMCDFNEPPWVGGGGGGDKLISDYYWIWLRNNWWPLLQKFLYQ